MRKLFVILLAGVSIAGTKLNAASNPADTIKSRQLEEVTVSAIRAGRTTPMAYSNLSEMEIKKDNAARNIPLILQSQPSFVAFTEDGSGVGNSSMRIRGTDATRINVTLNGMPLNNPESQEVFWVNLPDLSNALQSIQIQRGVGTSSNGSAAFGASISLKTTGARSEAYGEASTALGSYNTFASTLAGGTGILENGLSLDVRYSRVLGDGYIRNGKVNHSNLYAALSHYAHRQLIRLSYIKGVQHTGITWEGVTAEQMKDPQYGRRYNLSGEYFDEVGNRFYYDNETDNYYSDIVQLLFSRELIDNLMLNTSLSWNHGYGYYENYKTAREFKDFGLQPQVIDSKTYERSDMIRRKLMENDFYVANLGLEYSTERLKANFGALYSLYNGAHFGKLPWVKYWEKDNAVNLETFEWYRNNGRKGEFNTFAKAEYLLTEQLSLFGDLQYRLIDYDFSGKDDDLVDLTHRFNYKFFNPKTGLFYHLNERNDLYASVAVGQREPLRADLKDAIKGKDKDAVKPEQMIDYELGYRYRYENFSFGANLYYMDYRNQLVQTGKLNDVGYKLMENVARSYRAGLELELSLKLLKSLHFDANYTLSENKIKNYIAYFPVYDSSDKELERLPELFPSTHISYSPNHVGFARLTYTPFDVLYFNIQSKYVSKQYLDNTSDDERSLPAYSVTNLSAGYTFRKTGLGEISLQFFVNNLFDTEYIANGYASKFYYRDGGKDTPNSYVGYYPQAMRNYMARLTLRF